MKWVVVWALSLATVTFAGSEGSIFNDFDGAATQPSAVSSSRPSVVSAAVRRAESAYAAAALRAHRDYCRAMIAADRHLIMALRKEMISTINAGDSNGTNAIGTLKKEAEQRLQLNLDWLAGEGKASDIQTEPSPTTDEKTAVTFMGVGDKAARIVFICDASGSMLQRFDDLRKGIHQAVEALNRRQSFNVIFFQGDHCISMAPHLLPATDDNKARILTSMDIVMPRSVTDPRSAIKTAFDQHPQVIYLLTDGEFDPKQNIAAYIRNLNKGKRVKINTIAFITNIKDDPSLTLKQIAHVNGGTFGRVK